MNAKYDQKRDCWVCPICGDELVYCLGPINDYAYCPSCKDRQYDPDTGEDMGGNVDEATR